MSSLSITTEELQYQEQHWNDNRGPIVTVTTSIFYVFALAAVILRLVAQRIKHVSWQKDDYFIIIALIFASGLWIEALLAVRYGAGIHSFKVGIPHIVKSLQIPILHFIAPLIWVLEPTYNIAHFAIKSSILILFKNIFTLNIRPFKVAWYTLLAYVFLCLAEGIIVWLLQCRPIRSFWEQPLRCGNLTAEYLGSGATILVADLALLILPMPMLWSLQIKLRQKIQLCCLFSLGLLAVISSAVRMSAIAKIPRNVDFTFIEIQPLIWSIIEVDLGIICACIPVLRPIFTCGNRQAKPPTTGPTPLDNTSKAAGSRSPLHSLKSILAAFVPKKISTSSMTYPHRASYVKYSENLGGNTLGARGELESKAPAIDHWYNTSPNSSHI